MSLKELSIKLFSDLFKLGLPVDEVDIFLRPYSKTFYGRYFPTDDLMVKPKLYLYPFLEEDDVDLMPYEKILTTAIHEMCHHKQYMDESFKRLKGIMHNKQFWRMYEYYVDKAGVKNAKNAKNVCV